MNQVKNQNKLQKNLSLLASESSTHGGDAATEGTQSVLVTPLGKLRLSGSVFSRYFKCQAECKFMDYGVTPQLPNLKTSVADSTRKK
jgi:hypothetical protein